MDFHLSPKDKAIMLMVQNDRNKKRVINIIDTIRDYLSESVFYGKNKNSIDEYDYFTQVKLEVEKMKIEEW